MSAELVKGLKKVRFAGFTALMAGLLIVLFHALIAANLSTGFEAPTPGMLALLRTVEALGIALAQGGVIAFLLGAMAGGVDSVSGRPHQKRVAERDAALGRLKRERASERATREAARPTD